MTRRDEARERVREVYRHMEAEGGEALVQFLAFLGRERAAVNVVANLSEARRREYLDALDGFDRRLELFERWLDTAEGPNVRPATREGNAVR